MDPSDANRRRIEGQIALIDALAQAVAPESVAREVCEHATRLVGARGALVAMLTPRAETLDVLGHQGLDAASVNAFIDSPPLVARVLAGTPLVTDAHDAPGLLWPKLDAEPAAKSFAIVPLVTRRRVIGVLALAFDAPAAAAVDESGFLGLFAKHAAHALERGQLHDLQESWNHHIEVENLRFRSLVDELDAVFWEADPATFLFSFVSRRAETVLGYPTSHWLRPGFWASIIHPEDRSWAVDFCVQCTADGQDHVFEYRMLAADGRIVRVRDVVYVLRDETGKPAKLRGVMLDVTRDRDPAAPNVGRRLASLAARPHVAP